MENFLDEEFYKIQQAISLQDPNLIIVSDQNYESLENLTSDLVQQVKVFGRQILEGGTLKQELATIIRANDAFGRNNQKVDWKELFQTLEEGFDSADNLVSSCEVLQLVDYQINVKSFLDIDQAQSFEDLLAITQVQEKCIQWLTISNRVKDKSVAILAQIENQSFFDVLLSLEEKLVHSQQKIKYSTSELNNNDLVQQNIKLNADIEELLEEFMNLKSRFTTSGEDCTKAEVEAAELRRVNIFLDQQVKKLKEKEDFAEGLEDIERLNVLMAERDLEIQALRKSLSFFNILQRKILILGGLMKIKIDIPELNNDPDILVTYVTNLIETFYAQINQISYKSTQTDNLYTDQLQHIHEQISEMNNLINNQSLDKIQYAECLQKVSLKIEEMGYKQILHTQNPSRKIATLFNIKDTLRNLNREQDQIMKDKDNEEKVINRLRFQLNQISQTLQRVLNQIDNKYVKRDLDEIIQLIQIGNEVPTSPQLDETIQLQRKLQRQNQLQLEFDTDYKRLKDDNQLLLEDLSSSQTKHQQQIQQNQNEISQLKTTLKSNKKTIEDYRQESQIRNQLIEQSKIGYENDLDDLKDFHLKENQVQAELMKQSHTKWEKYLEKIKIEGDQLQISLLEKEKQLQEVIVELKQSEKVVQKVEFSLNLSKEQSSATKNNFEKVLISMKHQLEEKEEQIQRNLIDLQDSNQKQISAINKENQQQINGIKSKFEVIAQKLHESEVYTAQTESTVDSQRLIIEDLQYQLQNNQNEIELQNKNCSDLKIQFESQRQRNESAQSQQQGSQTKLNQIINQLKEEIEEDKKSMASSYVQIEKLNKQVREINQSLEQNNQQSQKLRLNINQLIEDQTRYHKLNNQQEQEIKSLQIQKDQLKNDLHRSSLKIKEIQDLLEQQNKYQLDLQKSMGDKIVKQTQELKSLNDSVDQLEQLNTSLQENIEIKDAKMESIQRRLNQQIQEIQLYEKRQEEVHILKDKNKKYMESALNGGEELMKLREQYQIMQRRYNEIDQEVKRQNEEYEQIKQSLKLAQVKILMYEKIMDESQDHDTQSKVNEKINLQDMLLTKQREIDILQLSYQKIVEQNEILVNQIHNAPSKDVVQIEKYKSQSWDKEVQFLGEKHLLKRELQQTKDKLVDMQIHSREIHNNDKDFTLVLHRQEDEILRLNEIVRNLSQKHFISERHRQN